MSIALRLRSVKANAVVLNAHRHVLLLQLYADAQVVGVGMVDHVLNRFLNDAINALLDVRRQTHLPVG